MKLTFFIILFFVSTSIYSQIEFRVFYENPCSGEITQSNAFYLMDSSFMNMYPFDWAEMDSVILLPKIGVYYLYDMRFDQDYDTNDSIKIDIEKFGKFNYTHRENIIQLRIQGMHGPYLYEKCGEELTGFHSDTFPSGQLRMCGNFLNGEPIDSLIHFYENGTVRKRMLFSKNKFEIQKYDTLSNLTMLSYHSRKTHFLSNYSKKEYYPTGNIKLKFKHKKYIDKFIEYYPNGSIKVEQKKNSRKEYFESGVLKMSFKKKRINLFDNFLLYHSFDYRISKKEYNENGELILEAKYDNWNSNVPHNTFKMSQSDWIIYLYRYENGKKVYSLEDTENIKLENNNYNR